MRDTDKGDAGKHAPANEFLITIRDREHPITKGLPDFWMHTKDECYSRLRGSAENLTVLATACDSPELKAAGRREPMLMTVQYHKGRVFHTTLGHDTEAFEGVSFITTTLSGTQWAASGKVTQKIPADFPTHNQPSARPFKVAGRQQFIRIEWYYLNPRPQTPSRTRLTETRCFMVCRCVSEDRLVFQRFVGRTKPLDVLGIHSLVIGTGRPIIEQPTVPQQLGAVFGIGGGVGDLVWISIQVIEFFQWAHSEPVCFLIGVQFAFAVQLPHFPGVGRTITIL